MRRGWAGPMLLYALFGGFFLLPFASGRIVESPANDLYSHVSAIAEARAALDEGQFPIRVTPRQVGGQRMAFFQFYGNFPYTAGALLSYLPGVNPYTAWKLMTLITVTAAGFYTYRSGVALTRRTWPSVVAGLVFVAAPYLSTDVRARFAYSEAVSFCLLPPVFYYSWRAFASGARGAACVLIAAVCWALLGLSHNITFLYGSTLIALFFLTHLTLRPRKDGPRFVRLGIAYALGVALVAWYVVPQLRLLSYMAIFARPVSPGAWATLVPLRVLVSPWLTLSPAVVGTPNMGLQIGWPILACAVIGLVSLVAGLARRGLQRGALARLLLAFVLATFIVWSPVDFWEYVPPLFYGVQFTYRILMFVVLWGAVLAAVALAGVFARHRGGMCGRAGLACAFLIGLAATPYGVWRQARMGRDAVKVLEAQPYIGEQAIIAFQTAPQQIEPLRVVPPPGVRILTAAEASANLHRGKTTSIVVSPTERAIVQVPVLFYPEVLDVRVDGQRVEYWHLDGRVTVDVPPGWHRIRIRFVGITWANWISGLAWAGLLIAAGVVAIRNVAYRRPRRLPGPEVPGAFPPRVAVATFVLLALPLTVSAAYKPLKNYLDRRALGTVRASSVGNEESRPEAAFDGDGQTAWAARGSGPAWLTVERPRPWRISRVVLEPRQTILLEAWHKVRVVLYLRGSTVHDQTFYLPDAPSQRVQELRLDKPVEADKVELQFADPVATTPSGDRSFDPALMNPGYREIRLLAD